MEKKMEKQKITMLVAALVFFASILVVVNIGETNATATALSATDTAYVVGDKFTIRHTYLQTGLATEYNYTVVGEESVNGQLCSKITMELPVSFNDQQILNYTTTVTFWLLKNSITKPEIKYEKTESYAYLNPTDNMTVDNSRKTVTTSVIAGSARTSISTNDTWNEIISKKSDATNTYGNITTNNTYYDNYTQNYTVISDSRGVIVPAATFSCYAINTSRNDTNKSYEVWFISDKWFVKREYYVMNDTTNLFEKVSTEELVSYKSGSTGGTGAAAKKGFVPGFEFALLALVGVSTVYLRRRR